MSANIELEMKGNQTITIESDGTVRVTEPVTQPAESGLVIVSRAIFRSVVTAVLCVTGAVVAQALDLTTSTPPFAAIATWTFVGALLTRVTNDE